MSNLDIACGHGPPLQLVHHRALALRADLDLVFTTRSEIPFAALLKQLRHHAGPSRLMAGADATAIVSMKILVEENQILPVRIMLELVRSSMNRPQSVLIAQEGSRETPRDLLRNFPEREEVPRPCRAFDLVFLAEIVVELLEGFDDQKVYRKPDRAPPVGIAAEQARARFSRLIFEAVLGRAESKHIRVVFVISRHGSNSIWRQKFVFIQHVSENTAELLAVHNGHEPALAHTGREHARLVLGVPRAIRNKPVEAPPEVGKSFQELGLERVDRVERNQSNHRARFHRKL